MRDPAERVRDMLEAISHIERYAACGKAALEQDELLQVWFLHHLQILGEAARSLPETVKTLAPSIPWSQIIGMRNVLVHGYFEVDVEIVWNAVSRDVLELRPLLEELLGRLGTG